MYHDLFDYVDGELFWKPIKERGFRCGGLKAGVFNKGYLWIKSKKLPKMTSVHRVIWEMHNGAVPEGMVVDHVNRNTLDNRIENLRLATRSQNSLNAVGKFKRKLPKNVYVDWCHNGQTAYRIQIIKDGSAHRVGNLSLSDAVQMVSQIRNELCGEYAVKEEDLAG